MKNSAKSLTLIVIAGMGLYLHLAHTNCKYHKKSQDSNTIKLACVGNSITFGATILNRNKNSYPAQLSAMLSSDWQVKNFGVCGATLIKKGSHPYRKQKAFKSALAFKPQVVVIMLGTNDSNPKNWQYKDEFVTDYMALIASFRKLENKPKIYLCLPVPIYSTIWQRNSIVLKEQIIPRIKQVADKTNLPIIDLYSALSNKKELFPDTVHPNSQGAGLIAREIYQALRDFNSE